MCLATVRGCAHLLELTYDPGFPLRCRAHECVQNALDNASFERRSLVAAIIALQHPVEAERLSKGLRRVVASHHRVHSMRNSLTNTVYRILYIRTALPQYGTAASWLGSEKPRTHTTVLADAP